MGANASNLIPVSSITPWASSDGLQPAKLSKADFVVEVFRFCVGGDSENVERFTELWGQIWPLRQKDPTTDKDLIEAGVFSCVIAAFRHKDDDWREAGIRIAYTFFWHPDIRRELIQNDFIGSLLLMAFVDTEDDDQEGEGNSAEMQERLENQSELQHLAVRIMCEMAKYDEFKTSLCSTATLNFLCIAMNQIPAASESVTHTFVRLSNDEEHLVPLMEGAVGSILESFFKKVKFRRPAYGDKTEILQWKHDVVALGYCAHTLGTFAKYNHICQVYLPKIINIFDYTIAREHEHHEARDYEERAPANISLVAEMSRLLYWICRRSPDQVATLQDASKDAQTGHPARDVLETLVIMWKKSVEVNKMVERGDRSKFIDDDYDPDKKLALDSYEVTCKIEFAQMSLCYLNCLLWVLLPVSNLRWRLKSASPDGGLKLHYAFVLRQESFLQVVLGTMRHLVDMPRAHECTDLIVFFGKQLLTFLDLAQEGEANTPDAPGWSCPPWPTALRLLLETISVLAMQRNMQMLLADNDIWLRLRNLQDKIESVQPMDQSINLMILRTFAEVAVHPKHRLPWLMEDPRNGTYPPRADFQASLENMLGSGDENCQTLASLLLSNFQTGTMRDKSEKELKMTFKSYLDWWQVNSTTRYEEAKMVVDAQQNSLALQNNLRVAGPALLQELLQTATRRKEESRWLTSIETLPYCAPHECVLVLSFFSRLALEPKFKKLFYDTTLDALLACVCSGIWAEAREAAATIANLMWLPDLNQELLVCWLKFDSASSTMVDAANVLLPIAVGNPQPASIGRGMYESTWGIEFGEGSCVVLHPQGLRTDKVPSTLTSASPMDTFACAPRPYEWLANDEEQPEERHFTVTCWFHWPLTKRSQEKGREHVLLQSSDRLSQISYERFDDGHGRWVLMNEDKEKIPLKTPELNPGWHMLALVSSTRPRDSTRSSSVYFEGTKFYLDDIATPVLKDTFTKNDFYMVGNGDAGSKPFGLISDFRIYARTLGYEEIKAMARPKGGTSNPLDSHPDRIVRRLTERNAAAILALRLDVPDSAAECLRALGSLATLVSQRARIYHLCGRQLMQMLNSPLPMIRRQATRILNSLR